MIGDIHAPFHDPKTIDLTLTFLREWQPDIVWEIGDMVDCYAISKFNKDPKRILGLQDEFDQAHNILKRLRAACPNAQIHHLDGNHELRMQALLWSKVPELSSLRELSVERLLGLGELGIEYHDCDCEIEYKNMLQIMHGTNVSKHSGWTAKAHYERYGGCGIIGHCHRGGNYLITKRGDTNGWWENFCLCDLNPEYVRSPNWQQGFSLGYFSRDRFDIVSVPIVQHRFVVDGKYYVWKKKGKVV